LALTGIISTPIATLRIFMKSICSSVSALPDRKGLFLMRKNKSLVRQVQDVLKSKLRIGEPKHLAKQDGTASDGIYSWSTYENYLAKCCAFVKWAKEEYGVCSLTDARQYVDIYLQKYIDEKYSPYTQKLIASALAKLYGCSTLDFIPTQTRHRAGITRSRGDKSNAKDGGIGNNGNNNETTKGEERRNTNKTKFSESRNHEFVDFCKAMGLRRHEIKNLKPENLGYDENTGRYMLVNIKGKGGKVRQAPILSDKVVERMKNTPDGQLVWSKVPSRADIHSYRADYCKAIYEKHARPINQIPKKDRYYCRGDLKGVVYGKRAMAIASRALGHNRIGVVAGCYLYGAMKS